MHFRVAVIGAGPAGSCCAAAFLLNGGADVALIDREVFPRDKSCGDGIGAGVLEVLDRLECPDLFASRRRMHLMEMHFHDQVHVEMDASGLHRPSPLGHVIPRTDFDLALIDQARNRGAADFTGWKLVDAATSGGGWRLELECVRTGESRQITCDTLIGADGARSRVRRVLGLDFDSDDYTAIAVRAYIDAPASNQGYQRLDIVDGMPHPGYAWLFNDGCGRANIGLGCSVPAWKGAGQKFPDLLKQYRERLGDSVSGEPEQLATAILPTGFWKMRVGFPDRRAALIGDAGSMINPAAGEGIFFAMYAGLVLGEELARRGDGDAGTAIADFDRAMKAAFSANFRDSRILMKLLSYKKPLEYLMRNFRSSPEFGCDFIEFLMGVMPPAKTRSLAGLAVRGLAARFGRSVA